MASKSTLENGLKAWLGDESVVSDFLNSVDEQSVEIRERKLIYRNQNQEVKEEEKLEEEKATELVVEEVVEEVEEASETVSDETIEFELTDEFVDELAVRIAKIIGYEELKAAVDRIARSVEAQEKEDNDDLPIKSRKVIRPTLRNSETTERKTVTKEQEAEDTLNRNSRTDIQKRREENLAKLRQENNATNKKRD